MVQNTEKTELNPTQELIAELEAQGFTDLEVWQDEDGVSPLISVRKPKVGGGFNVIKIIPGRREVRVLIPGGGIGEGVLYEDLQEKVVSEHISPYLLNWGDEPLKEIDNRELAEAGQDAVNKAVEQAEKICAELEKAHPQAKVIYMDVEEIYDEVWGKRCLNK